MEKCKVDNKVLSKHTEVSAVSSERVHSSEQTSIRSDIVSDANQPVNRKRKDLGSFMEHHSKVYKIESSSSKESEDVVQQSSVDSSKEIYDEKRPNPTHSSESNVVSYERELSIITKLDRQSFKFNLNQGMEAKGAIPVVAKVGVPMGPPKKPLQFRGELGWRRTGSVSAFQPASLKFPKIEKEMYNMRGIDLNVAADMDFEHPSTQSPTDFVTSKPPARFLLDLNSCNEDETNLLKLGSSSFNLNGSPEDTRDNLVHQSENQQRLRRNGAVDSRVGTMSSENNASRSIFDVKRAPSYWIDMSSMRGIRNVQPQPFLVAPTPSVEQVQMVVPSGLYIGKINNFAPNFYPPIVSPQMNNHHVMTPIPNIQGPVLAAYPSHLQHVENQGIVPHVYANMRPNSIANGSIPFMDGGKRGAVNSKF